MQCRTTSVGLALLLAAGIVGASERPQDAPDAGGIPDAWLAAWNRPPAPDRPLQIIHGIDSRRALPEGIHQMLHEKGPAAITVEQMKRYQDRGLGGVVANVAFADYLRSEANWQTLMAGVAALEKLGMVVWIYDEEGYPSGAAGGLVLKENPQFEATALAYDPARQEPFILQPAYEFTHASNNYFAARRYINLIDDRAVRSFIAKTHEAYWQRLGPHFGATVQAMFTDEPSLIAVDLGQIPEPARQRVRVVDPIDPAARPLPTVPWCYDLAQRYRERYAEDLSPRRRSLFVGGAPEDRRVRRQFWQLVADLIAQRYFGAIQQWCAERRIASSGHTLHEESLIHHVPLEGNALKVLGRMDIPGLDLLTSDPEAVLHSGWLTAALPASAAALHGRRRVMTEVSDFSQTQSGRGPAGLAEMQATAAWQAAWGVTEFTLYYAIAQRSVEQYRAYCDYVGRLNAVVKPARPAPQVLLYYPIYDLWPEYLPVAGPLRLDSQSARAQQVVRSFMRLGQTLQHAQIPFLLVDHELLASAEVRPGGKLAIRDHLFDALLLPDRVELPDAPAAVVDRFRQQGGRVLAGPWEPKQLAPDALIARLQPAWRLAPAATHVAMGQFVRDGRLVLLAVNVGKQPYDGALACDRPEAWKVMDPATGAIAPAERHASAAVQLALAPRQALLLVQNPAAP